MKACESSIEIELAEITRLKQITEIVARANGAAMR
jgi:hypothetical protein